MASNQHHSPGPGPTVLIINRLAHSFGWIVASATSIGGRVIPGILQIARHELKVAFRTKRALWVAGIYLGSAILGGLALVLSMRLIEQQILKQLIASGVGEADAAGSISLLSEPAYRQLASFFSGVEVEQLAEAFRQSLIAPFFFWGSLAFMPFLILLTSFDQMAADLESRAICYYSLRVSRPTILLGKVLAQAVVFVGLTVLASLVWVVLATSLLSSFSFTDALPGLLRMGLLLLPFGCCYLAISAFCSSLVRQPFVALLTAFALIIVLRVIGWARYVPTDGPIGLLHHLEWISPATYQKGLWLAGWSGPLASVGAYAGFTVLFMALAVGVLGRRDL